MKGANMKETKVYVDELPKSCVGGKYFAEHRRQCNLELCFQWSEEKQKYNDCPLKSLHDHDKEKVSVKEDTKWQELKEWIKKYHDWNLEQGNNGCALGQWWVLNKMQELEGEDENTRK